MRQPQHLKPLSNCSQLHSPTPTITPLCCLLLPSAHTTAQVFVSDAQSTAYQYPMTDARLFKDADTGRVAAEVPLVSHYLLRLG